MDRLNEARGLKPRRLSSTPIKSPPKSARQRCASLGGGGVPAVPREANTLTAREEMPTGQIHRMNQVCKEDKDDNRGAEEHRNSDATSFCMSDLEDEEVAVEPSPPFPSTLCFPAQPQQLYDRRSYQDPSRDAASDETQDDESDSALSTAESTLTDDRDGKGSGVVFDDDETWYDPEETPVVSPVKSEPAFEVVSERISPPERQLYRNAGASRAVDVTSRPASQEPDPAAVPPSQLMAKLFPSLKAKTQNAPLAGPPPRLASDAASKTSEMETGELDTCEESHFVCVTVWIRATCAYRPFLSCTRAGEDAGWLLRVVRQFDLRTFQKRANMQGFFIFHWQSGRLHIFKYQPNLTVHVKHNHL